jgi:hypothetical protein
MNIKTIPTFGQGDGRGLDSTGEQPHWKASEEIPNPSAKFWKQDSRLNSFRRAR